MPKIKFKILKLTLLFLIILFSIGSIRVYAAGIRLQPGQTLNLTEDTTYDWLIAYGNEDNWITVTGPGTLTVTGSVSGTFISFQNTGSVNFQRNVSLYRSVFDGNSQVNIGLPTTPLSDHVIIESSDFRNQQSDVVLHVQSVTGDSVGIFRLKGNTFVYSNPKVILLEDRNGADIDSNIFYNTQLGTTTYWTVSGGHTFRNNFFSSDSSVTNYRTLTVNGSTPPVTFKDNYCYYDFENPHPFPFTSSGESGTDKYTGNVIEVVFNTDGANIFNSNSTRSVEVLHNILIGSGSLVNAVGSNARQSVDVVNNTCYSKLTGNSNDGLLFLSESGPSAGDISINNNIVTGSTDPGKAVASITGTQVITHSDHNVFYNVTAPYNNVDVQSGQTDDISIDPQFRNPTDLVDWGTKIGVGTTKAEIVSALLARNGYDSVTKKQNGSVKVDYPLNLINYVKSGYTPTNQAVDGRGAVPYSDTTLKVWIDNSIKKYRQDGEDGTSGAQSHHIEMAKNEFESFQVFVYADGENLNNVDVTVSNFTKGSDTINDIYLYKEWYVSSPISSRIEYKTGAYPDALLPKVDRFYHEQRNTFPFNVSNGKVQGVWVDVGTEISTTPGTYTATVTVSADGKPDVHIPVTLEVFDFALPSTSNFPATYIIRADAAVYGHGLELNYNTTQGREIISQYLKMFLYNRTIAWIRGDGYSMGYTWDDANKILTITDYNPWENWMIPVMNGTAITAGPYSGAKFPILNVPRNDMVDRDSSIANDDKVNAARQYLQQVYNRFLTNGWDPINRMFSNVIDEPQCDINVAFRGVSQSMCDVARLQAEDAQAINTNGLGVFNNIYVHSRNTRESFTDFEDYGFYSTNIATLACPNWNRTCSGVATPSSPRDGYKDSPFWPYMGCSSNGCRTIGGESTSNQVDSSVDADAMYNRLASFYRYMVRSTGSFFWGTCDLNYTNDPYESIWSDEFTSNGDGHLLYAGIPTRNGRTWTHFSGNHAHTPAIGGTHDIPIASIRWKYIRDQQEDLEYFRLAENSTDRNTIINTIKPVFNGETDPKLAYWTLNMDTNVLLSTRNQIADLITGSSSQTCDSSHLNFCTDQSSCQNAGGNWCNNTCQANSCSTEIRADVNQDNQVNTTDALLTLRKSLNLDMSQTNWQDSPTTGDVNCDNNITTVDALLLLRQSVGLDMSNTEWCGE